MTTLLAVDERWVGQVFAMRRRVTLPQIADWENPLIPGGYAYGSVLRDDDGLWRMWYMQQPIYSEYLAYSQDGLHWELPELSRLPAPAGPNAFLGPGLRDSAGRWLVEDKGPEGFCVLDAKTTPHPAARSRFMALYLARGIGWRGLCLAHSEDGITWSADERNPVLTGWRDTSQAILYDPAIDEYVVYGRPQIHVSSVSECNRLIARTSSRDLSHWFPERSVLDTDDRDADAFDLTDEGVIRAGRSLDDAKAREAMWAEITEGAITRCAKPMIRGRNRQWYGITPFIEHGLYLALGWLYDVPSGETWMELIHSADGVVWQRESARTPWLAQPGAIICAMSTPPVLADGRHSFYLSHPGTNHHGTAITSPAGIRAASIARDRWLSYESGPLPGELLSQSLPSHESVRLNLDLASTGWLRVEQVRPDGGCRNRGDVRGGGLDTPIQWVEPYSAPPGCRLRLVSTHCKLYAVMLD